MAKNLTDVLKVSVDAILKKQGISASGEAFTGGLTATVALRPTQAEALMAYSAFLNRDDLSAADKKRGYFEIPTGIGKTGVFVSLVREAYKDAIEKGQSLRTVIIVPTTELLTQTRDEFLQYAPELEDDIGLYGGLDRELGQPVTIITYDSWSQLTERGELSSHNVDLLISDEAHRGTSERRAEHFFDAYGNGTVHIAFTATAHFDEEKSVLGTHKNEIFYKSLPETVRGGEQAAYIHSQLYVIRVAPDDRKIDFSIAAQGGFDKSEVISSPEIRRQAAWNQRVAHIYAHGQDKITGEPLSDNQAAFFTSSVAQANALEAYLNADPILAEKAKEKGCIGVCAAIHSYMSPLQQRQRFLDFKAGKYMAIAGDGKFKEGFDHRPLKVIFDSQRGSIVDKAQIIGRAARQWWNEIMHRFEGMTFVDTVVYHGSDDPKQDKISRARALRNAILASAVLEGTEIFSRHYDRPVSDSKRTGSAKIFDEFEGVEEYATLEDIHNIHAEISVLKRENTIELTAEMRSELHALLKRKGLGPESVYRLLDPVIVQAMRPMTVAGWIHGNYRRVPCDQWEAVKAAALTVPDIGKQIVVTPEDARWIKEAIIDKNAGARRLHQIMDQRGEWPEGLTENKINAWAGGLLRSGDAAHWHVVKRTLQSLPSIKMRNLTQDDKKALAKEIEEKNFGERKITNALGDDLPEGLTHQMVRGWYRGTTAIVPADHWDAVQRVLKDIDPVRNITAQDKVWLRTQFANKGIEQTEILSRLYAQGFSLNKSSLSRLIGETARTVSLPLWNALVEILEASELIYQTTPQDRVWLREQTDRTGLTASTFTAAMNNQGIEAPEGFDVELLEKWRSGNNKTLPAAHWHVVTTVLKNAPDAGKRITISEQDRVWLEKQISTKMTPVDIVRALGDKAGELTGARIHHWQKGSVVTAYEKEWNAVKAILEAAPLKAKKHAITEAERVWLEDEISKKINPAEIVRRLGKNTHGVTFSMIHSWVKGAKAAPEAGWNAVKAVLVAAQESKKRTLTDQDRNWLAAQLEYTGMSFKELEEAVQHQVSKTTFESWLKGKVTEADEADWNKAISVLRNYAPLSKAQAGMLREIQKDHPDLVGAFTSVGQKFPETFAREQTLSRIFKGWAKALPREDIETLQAVYDAYYPRTPKNP